MPMDIYSEGRYKYYIHFESLYGKNVSGFIDDLKKDESVVELEVEGNNVFFLIRLPDTKKVPTPYFNHKVFYLKPILVDNKGVEHWEIASWKKEYLMEFINHTKATINGLKHFKLVKIVKTNLTYIYYPQIMPNLTPIQKECFELAVTNGYYDYPRSTDLESLAKLSKRSLSTYRQHLRVAEKKIMPDLLSKIRDC
jgi:predicted DNA binding protein